MRKRMFWVAPLAILGMVLFAALGGYVVMWLWNWLLPGLFGWRLITFWQALALLALCRILFGRIGGRGFGRSKVRERMRERMRERWERMTPEEREKVRGRWGRCGGFEPPEAKGTV